MPMPDGNPSLPATPLPGGLRRAALGVSSLFRNRRREARRDPRRISVAITTWNSENFIEDALVAIADDPRIDDIVIQDDCTPAPMFAVMVAKARDICPSVRIGRNPHNLGSFQNKHRAVAQCRNDRAILLDGDNRLTHSYVDRLFDIPAWDPSVIYCPERAAPAFDFTRFSGQMIDRVRAGRILADDTDKTARTFLNTGNYFVPVRAYLDCFAGNESVPVRAGCAMAFNYLWLQAGNRLLVVPGMSYRHRIHEQSNFLKRANEARSLHKHLRESLSSGTPYRLADFHYESTAPTTPS